MIYLIPLYGLTFYFSYQNKLLKYEFLDRLYELTSLKTEAENQALKQTWEGEDNEEEMIRLVDDGSILSMDDIEKDEIIREIMRETHQVRFLFKVCLYSALAFTFTALFL